MPPNPQPMSSTVRRPREELGGDVALFRMLRVVEGLTGMLEIGAGILTVRIEEQVVQARVEVVVMSDVVLGARRSLR